MDDVTFDMRNRIHYSEPVSLELEVTSLRPKAFIIKHFLNDFEAEAIIEHD